MNTTTQKLRVADLMTRHTQTINEHDDLVTAIATLNRQSLSVLPVLDRQNRVCGIISVSDLLPLIYNLQCDVAVLPIVSEEVRKTLTDALAEDNQERKVSDLMTHMVKTISPTANIQQAAQQLLENSIHHLPVVDDSHRVVGILSMSDIVRSVAYFED